MIEAIQEIPVFELKLEIPMPPISVNSALTYSKNTRRKVKTSETKRWERDFYMCLLQYQRQMKEFAGEFKIDFHAIEEEIIFLFPREKIMTNSKRLKKGRFDIDNLVKIPNDIIFKTLGIDDAMITEQYRSRRVNQDGKWKMIFKFKIISKERVYEQTQ